MPGAMIVRQRVESVERWQAVFHDPALDAVRREHGLVVTGTYVDAGDASTVIVLMDMEDVQRAAAFARSEALAEARERAGAAGPPDAVWYAVPQQG